MNERAYTEERWKTRSLVDKPHARENNPPAQHHRSFSLPEKPVPPEKEPSK
jgi:hypothetical protein